MATCGKCGNEMERRKDWWHCKCGFKREIAKKLPTYEELEEENRQLKKQIEELTKTKE